ncbi:MAG: hypothetical protein U9R58_14645 [Chloroflexota bacterium]|nr:hypothetical protein [Chloroflexota bacterium]
MTEQTTHISNRVLRTPRAAAIAGIIFAVLYGAGYVLIQLSLPVISPESVVLSENQARSISLGLSFLPFAGIAFLWFMGVIRDRLGKLEDQFFSTLFLGSGLLYVALIFASAAIAGGILAAFTIDPDLLTGSDGLLVAREITRRINTIYAVRMAGMFMIVLGTIWVRTQVMPRLLALITYGLALVLLISIGFTHWVTLVFPTWVFLISVFILILNYRYQEEISNQDGMTLKD